MRSAHVSPERWWLGISLVLALVGAVLLVAPLRGGAQPSSLTLTFVESGWLDAFGGEPAAGAVGTTLVNAANPSQSFSVNVFNDADFLEIWGAPPR